jgi:hypothetical protein
MVCTPNTPTPAGKHFTTTNALAPRRLLAADVASDIEAKVGE